MRAYLVTDEFKKIIDSTANCKTVRTLKCTKKQMVHLMVARLLK